MNIPRMPTFIIGGAPRSGTSWLYELLNTNPKIRMISPRQPEPKFFLDKTQYDQGAKFYYEKYLASLPEADMYGEKSSNYLEKAPEVAPRIFKIFPNVKLIFILRNPIYRAWSNYLWSTQNGLENIPFEEALENEEARDAALPDRLKIARPFSYFQRGLYAEHLNSFLKIFPKNQVFADTFENFISSPHALENLADFLNIDPNLCSLKGIINENNIGQPLPQNAAALLGEKYRSTVKDLESILNRKILEWGEFY